MSDNEIFDEILLEIVEQEEKKIFTEFGSIDVKIESLYNRHSSNDAVFDEIVLNEKGTELIKSNADEKTASKVSYAASLGIKLALNLCVAKDLKDAVDARFADDPDDKLCAQMKEYVEQKLAFQENTDEEKKFAETIKKLFDKHIAANGTTEDFMTESYYAFDYAFNLISRIKSGNRKVFEAYLNDEPREINNTFTLKEALIEAVRIYAKELKNTVIAPLDYRFVDEMYHEKVEPNDFLESYNKWRAYAEKDRGTIVSEMRKILKNSLGSVNDRVAEAIVDFYGNIGGTTELREENIKRGMEEYILTKKAIDEMDDAEVAHYFNNFCDEEQLTGYHILTEAELHYSKTVFRMLAESLDEYFDESEKENAAYALNFDDFIVDGKRAESEEEVVAGAISGRKIQSDYFDDKLITIQPAFYLSENSDNNSGVSGGVSKSVFSELLSQLWEGIKSVLGISEKDKERRLAQRAEKSNEKLQQSQSRQKMTFAEVVDDKFSNKLVAPEKREEIKNKRLDKKAPTKK